MRVLFIHNCAERSGAAHSLLGLMEGLTAHGVKPIVACPPGQVFDFFRQRNLEVHAEVPLPYLFSGSGAPLKGMRLIPFAVSLRDFFNVRAFRRQLKEINPDIVHLNERSMIFAAKQARHLGFPVVMHARNVACQQVHWAQSMCENYINKYVDRLIAIDLSVRQSLPLVRKATVVYNPIHSDAAMQTAPPSPTNSIKNLLFLANLMDVKGIWDLLEAIRMLKSRNDFRLLLLGGNSRPPAFFQSLKGRVAKGLGIVKEVDKQVLTYIKEQGLENRVHLKGFVENIDTIIRDSYVNLFPSHLNGPSRSVFEAGIAGVPTILALRTKVEDVVQDGVNGLIVEERNPRALAAAIARLLDNPKLRDQLGRNAQQQFRVQFSRTKSAADVFQIYQEILSSQPSADTITPIIRPT